MATKKRMIGVHVDEADYKLAKALAADDGESLAVLIRTLLRAEAKRRGRVKP